MAYRLAGLVFATDVLTKTAIVLWVESGARHDWMPVLNIVHVLNRGAAFSFLHDAGGWQRPLFVAIALAASAFLVYGIRNVDTLPADRIGFGMILGGALANMVDRIARGAVVDWIDLHWSSHHWPAFNVADIGITLGAAWIVVHAFLRGRRSREAKG